MTSSAPGRVGGGLCGWINWHPGDGNASATLAEMMRRAGSGRIHPAQEHTGADFAIAAVEGGWPAEVFADDSLCVAFYGEPTWKETESSQRESARASVSSIAAAYRKQGQDLLPLLWGPFSLIIIDRMHHRALLAIDRLGIHTLHYRHFGEVLTFATSGSSIAAHPAARAEVDPQGVFDYLYFHVVPAPRTIYRNQRKLLPAQCARFEGTRGEERFYWQLEYQDDGRASEKDLQEEFRSLLRKVVRRAARDLRPGAFLSGGTDSSTVSGILSEIREEPPDTYSIGFDVPGYDEMSYATVAAKHFGTRHHAYYVQPGDVVEAVPWIAQTYDEPFGNASAVPVYFCARLARETGSDTLLAGDGGDEIFAGNERYAKQKLFELYGTLSEPLRVVFLEPLIWHMPGSRHVPPLRKARSYIEQARIPLPDRLHSYNFLHRATLQDVLTDDFLREIDGEEPGRLVRENYFRARSSSPLNRMMFLDLKLTLADNDLRKVNGMCEMAGVRVRYPLLDEELVEFSARVPAKMKLRGLQLRYFFKKALSDFLPPETLRKEKHGFGLPVGVWMKDDVRLRELVRESLASLEGRGILRRSYIDKLSHLHQSEHGAYYGVMLWALTVLEQWCSTHHN